MNKNIVEYKSIYYPPGGILLWIIITLELLTFGMALIALVYFSKEDPQLRLIVLGAFEDDLDPISAAAKNILETNPAIIHIDWSDRVEYFMHIAELLLHASYREGFPNTLL